MSNSAEKPIFLEFDTEDFKNGVNTLAEAKDLNFGEEPELEFEVDHFFSYQTKILSKNGLAGLLNNSLELDTNNLILNLNFFSAEHLNKVTQSSYGNSSKKTLPSKISDNEDRPSQEDPNDGLEDPVSEDDLEVFSKDRISQFLLERNSLDGRSKMTQDYYGPVEDSNDIIDFTKKKSQNEQIPQEEFDATKTFIKMEYSSSGKGRSAEMNAEIEYMFWTSKKIPKMESNQSFEGQILQVSLTGWI